MPFLNLHELTMGNITIKKTLSLKTEEFHQKLTDHFKDTAYAVDYTKGMIGKPVVCVTKNKFLGVWVNIVERKGNTIFSVGPFIPSVAHRIFALLLLTIPAILYTHIASSELRKAVEQFIKGEYEL